jgi:hypothetical protein
VEIIKNTGELKPPTKIRARKTINTGVSIPPKSWSKANEEILKSDKKYFPFNYEI